MKFRVAVMSSNPKITMKVYRVSVHMSGWEWYWIMDNEKQRKKDAKDDITGCFVQSPICPEGEFGFSSISDLNKYHGGGPWEAMAPVGWYWEDEEEDVAA